MINGIINIYKEKEYTSHDVVAKMRGILRQKKIGHTGTLDPDATGVLPVCLGSATKLCDMLTDKSKEYIADFVLGKETDTQDISGKVLYEFEGDILKNYTEEEIKSCIYSFIGEYMQVPPMYSAKKVGGKKLVDLARQGIEIKREPVRVEFKDIEILDINIPKVKIRVECSKGTYIRTLCHDIGKKLGTAACMTNLQRTKVGDFKIDRAIKLSDLEKIKNNEQELIKHILPIDKYFIELDTLVVKEKFYKQAINGNKLSLNQILAMSQSFENKKRFKIYTSNKQFLGIYEYIEKEKVLKPYKLFIGEVQ